MKKVLFIVSTCIFSMPSFSSDKQSFSFGLGTDQGGLGVKYSSNRDKSKFYGSLGLLSYSESSGTNLGYGLGWEHLLGNSGNHTLGLFLGSISNATRNKEKTTYHGAALTYNYYFKGFTSNSFVIGASAGYGTSSNDKPYFDDSKSLISVKISYQW